ncbi:DUF2877 domain-containing protein [Carnobacterium sp.]|uniref:DUF2877 domain-containing protein n=1 Tax=Carnobacterium sp. TaxID=48221 RepID=UPI0028A656A3|nr:DUF2877 domain-containing protein [Carnobacterium sp.]
MLQEYKEEKSSYLTAFFKGNHVGIVHSLFTHSLNIKLGKQLVHVSDMLEPLSAFGVKLKDEKIQALLTVIKIGDFVSCQNQTLTFYNQWNKVVLVVALELLTEIQLKIEPFTSYPKCIEETAFFKELSRIPVHMRTGLPLSSTTTGYLEELSNYPKDPLSNVEQSAIINHLVGRGIGLTPSGDDLLIGYTSILTLLDQQHEWLKTMQQVVRTDKTTAISIAYLQCLLEGVVNENIKELIDLFYLDDQKLLQKKMERMLLFGHTSGTDTLFGMLIGTKAMIKREKSGK